MFDFLCVWREWVVFYVPFFKYGIIQFGPKTDLAPVDKTLYFAVWWRLHKWAKHSLAWCSTNKHEFALTIISGFWLTIKKSSDLTHPGMECTTTAHTITSKTLGETDPIMHHSINQWGYLSYENDIFLQVFFLIIFSYNVSLLRVGIKDRFTTCQIINIMYLRLNPFANQIIGILFVLEDVNDDTCGTWNILSQYVAKSLWYPLVVPSHFERGCWWDRGFLQWRTVWCSQVLA